MSNSIMGNDVTSTWQNQRGVKGPEDSFFCSSMERSARVYQTVVTVGILSL